MEPPEFGRSVNPISTGEGGGRLHPPHYYWPLWIFSPSYDRVTSKVCLIESLIVKAKFIFYRHVFLREHLLSTATQTKVLNSNQLVSCFIPFYTIDTALKSKLGTLILSRVGTYLFFCLIFYLENSRIKSLSGK